MSYKKNGIINMDLVKLPENWKKSNKFFPVIECIEKIPCNPCDYSCPTKAITVKGDITNLPDIDYNKCNACTICVGKCPGLAIFMINPNYTEKSGAVILPYEFMPLPEEENKVFLLNRKGKEVGEGKVLKVKVNKAFENTPLITVEVPKELVNEVRHIRKAD
ncbi:MAG: 4Fe-4S ferredoxin [Candidatus Muiribacteriota bacterium]